MGAVLGVAAVIAIMAVVVVVLARSARRRRSPSLETMAALFEEAGERAPEPISRVPGEATGANILTDEDWIDREATASLEDADRRSVIPTRDPSPEAPAPSADYDYDYGELQRDLGLTERTGGALAIGLISLVVVVLIGVWILGSTHHGNQTPVHFNQVPIQGPQEPQGSIPP